mgnify:CR=1 FL=1
MSMKMIRVRILDPKAVRMGSDAEGRTVQTHAGMEYDAHPLEAKLLLQSGAVELVDGSVDVRGLDDVRPMRAGREYAVAN